VRSLDLAADPVELCAALVDVPSVSGEEGELASALEAALRAQAPHLQVLRSGHAVLARTALGREKRVLLAGHIDTVPIAGNVPSRRDGDRLYGCGTSDMKAGDAVFAHLAAVLPEP
jgi:succinyl-diaminopimelate desuccinylase